MLVLFRHPHLSDMVMFGCLPLIKTSKDFQFLTFCCPFGLSSSSAFSPTAILQLGQGLYLVAERCMIIVAVIDLDDYVY